MRLSEAKEWIQARQARDERIADKLRHAFRESGTLVLNLVSAPGAGKTSLLEATVETLWKEYRIGAVTADVATERDAERLRALGIPARQILVGDGCHLEARRLHQAVCEEVFRDIDILFIENVGNLICPPTRDLGEDFKVAMLSVPEGDDRPFKYPGAFSRSAVSLITKVDLLPWVDFDIEAVSGTIGALNPRGRVLLISARTGAGIQEWCQLLRESHAAKVSLTCGAV